MTEPSLTPPPHLPPGSRELAEWEAIAAGPSAHTLAPQLAPEAPEHLAALEQHRAELADLAAPDEHARSLSPSGVLFGPDCSQYQGKPDWRAVRASGCVIGGYKVSEGRTFIDPTHAWNRAQTKAAGLVPLAYHYLYYSDEYANNPALWALQADWFVDNADPAAIHVLDVEAPATSGHHLGVKEWVAQYRKRLPNHPLGVYANRALWQNRSRMPYDPAGLFDFVWHAGVGNGYYTSAAGSIQAQWSAQGGLVNSLAAVGYPTCKLWQITDHAKVPGVGGSFCDGNAFTGTLEQLRALATGTTEDDDMTAADVQAIKDYIDAALDAKLRAYFSDAWVHNPVMAAPAGTVQGTTETNAKGEKWTAYRISPLNMLNEVFRKLTPGGAVMAALGQVAAQTDTVEGSLAGIKTAIADDPTLQQFVDALHTSLGSGEGGQLTRSDVEDAVSRALTEHLSRVHLAVDAAST
jgi:hypothetical protein